MVVGDTALTQVEEPLIDTGVQDTPSTSDRVSIAIVETGSRYSAGIETSYGYSERVVSPNGQTIIHDNGELY